MAQITATTTITPSVKSATGAFTAMSDTRGKSSGASETMPRASQYAMTNPTDPPIKATTRISVSHCLEIAQPAGAQRQPDAQFVAFASDTGEQQARHVRARNQQQHHDSRPQHANAGRTGPNT